MLSLISQSNVLLSNNYWTVDKNVLKKVQRHKYLIYCRKPTFKHILGLEVITLHDVMSFGPSIPPTLNIKDIAAASLTLNVLIYDAVCRKTKQSHSRRRADTYIV